MPTYYVKNGGNDSLDGLSDANAWATLDKVSNFAFQPGDNILFARGSVWRAELFFPSSGTSSQPITIGAYGSGANPMIRGDDVVTGWTTEPPATVPAGENFTDGTGSKPLAWWMMAETSGNRASSAGSSDALVPSASPPTRGSGPYSYFSAEFNRANSQQFNLPESGMSANFPGRSGVANGSLTVGAWVRIDAETGSGGGIMGKGANWNLFIEGGSVRFLCFGPGFDGAWSSEEGAAYSAGVWRHYAGRIIRNATTGENELNLFVNGVKKPSAFAPDRDTSANDLTIGNAIFRSSLHGAMAEVFVFNEALTDAQILDIATKGLDGTRTSTGPTLYYKGFASQPGAVFANDVPLQQASFKVEMSPGNQWWDSANLRQYIRLAGDADPATVEMSAAVRTFPMRMHSNSWWIVEDFYLKGAHQSNLFTSSASNGIVRRCTLSHAGKAGMHLYGETGTTTGGIQVLDCVAHTNAAGGIEGSSLGDNTSMSNITVARNETYGNCWGLHLLYTGGIRFTGRPISNLTIEDNYVHDEGIDGNLSRGVGIWFDTTGAQSIGRRNRIERTTSWGIHIEDVDNAEAYSNLIVGSIHHPGIGVVRSCNGNKVYNNTIIDCAGGLDASNYDGVNFLNNQFYNNLVSGSVPVVRANNGVTTAANASFNKNLLGPQGANFIEWNGMVSTYAAWETALGTSTNSIQTNPTFVDAETGNYRLDTGSSGIAAGAPITVGTLDYDKLAFNATTPSIGAFEFAAAAHQVSGAVAAQKPMVTATVIQTFPSRTITGTVVAQKPTIAATATQTFPARSVSGTVAAKKPTIAATVAQAAIGSASLVAHLTAPKPSIAAISTTSALASSPFSTEFSYEFGGEILAGATVTASLGAKKPVLGATATQTFTARAISGTISAKKPILAATVSQSIAARFLTATIQAKKPTVAAAVTQTFPSRALSAVLISKKPAISATAAAANLPARSVTAILVAPRPTARGTASTVTISPHLRAPPWRTVDAGTGSAQASWAAPLDPNALLDFTMNWNDEMSAGDTIQSAFLALSSQAAAAGLKIHSESHDEDSVTAWLKVDPFFQTSPAWSGAGETHQISCRVSTTVGRIHDRTFTLTVRTT